MSESPNRSDNNKPLSPCKKVSIEEFDQESNEATAEHLLKLGADIQAKINESKKVQQQSSLRKLNEQVKLSEMLSEYFDLDEDTQKARMLDFFTENIKNQKKIKSLEDSIDLLNRQLQDEKDFTEEYKYQIEVYLEETEKNEKNIEKLNEGLKKMQAFNEKLNNRLIEYQNRITNYQFFHFIVIMIFSMWLYLNNKYFASFFDY